MPDKLNYHATQRLSSVAVVMYLISQHQLMQTPVLFCSQLKLAQPEHVLVKRMSAAEDSFDRASQAMA
jgi:hypothetical protein